MSKHQEAIDAAMTVLDDFMASLNAIDEAGVNYSFNIPHVCFAGGGDTKIFREAGQLSSFVFSLADRVGRLAL